MCNIYHDSYAHCSQLLHIQKEMAVIELVDIQDKKSGNVNKYTLCDFVILE